MSNGRAFVRLGIGKRRTGKTTKTKEILKQFREHDTLRKLVIYDTNNEFTDFHHEYSGNFQPFDDFMKQIENTKNSFIHIEEATIFFDTRSTNKPMNNLLVRCRHMNNVISLNFHSWGQVPKNILSLVDYITVFKTNDSFDTVKKKIDNEKLLNAWNKVMKSEDNFSNITVNLNS